VDDPVSDSATSDEVAKPEPRWLGPGALALLAIAVSLIFHARLAADFWPLDSSRVGPNLLAAVVQGAIVFIAARGLHARHDQHAAALKALNEKLDHLTKERTP
jgi:hypothetical protein